MSSVIVSDTSCLILLDKLGKLDLLESLFDKVIITQIIAAEFNKPLPSWMHVENIQDNVYQKILQAHIDVGEASALALGLQIEEALLVLDDLKARNYAKRLGLRYTGTLGILIEAKHVGLIKEIRPLLNQIEKTDFRLSEELIRKVLRIAHEA